MRTAFPYPFHYVCHYISPTHKQQQFAYIHTRYLSLPRSLSLTHTLALSLSLSLSISLSLPLYLSLYRSLSHTHTHTIFLSLSLSLPLSPLPLSPSLSLSLSLSLYLSISLSLSQYSSTCLSRNIESDCESIPPCKGLTLFHLHIHSRSPHLFSYSLSEALSYYLFVFTTHTQHYLGLHLLHECTVGMYCLIREELV